jgi:hypothetical protein
MHDLPLNQGFAMIAWAVENDTMAPAQRVGLGYLGQELELIRKGAQ